MKRVTACQDRGVLKFRISQKGIVIGFLTLDGLVRWMDNQNKPTSCELVSLKQK